MSDELRATLAEIRILTNVLAMGTFDVVGDAPLVVSGPVDFTDADLTGVAALELVAATSTVEPWGAPQMIDFRLAAVGAAVTGTLLNNSAAATHASTVQIPAGSFPPAFTPGSDVNVSIYVYSGGVQVPGLINIGNDGSATISPLGGPFAAVGIAGWDTVGFSYVII
jgi:hypothetical protein